MCWKAPRPDEAVTSSKWNRSVGILELSAGAPELGKKYLTGGQKATIANNGNEAGNFIIHIMLRISSIGQQAGLVFQLKGNQLVRHSTIWLTPELWCCRI